MFLKTLVAQLNLRENLSTYLSIAEGRVASQYIVMKKRNNKESHWLQVSATKLLGD